MNAAAAYDDGALPAPALVGRSWSRHWGRTSDVHRALSARALMSSRTSRGEYGPRVPALWNAFKRNRRVGASAEEKLGAVHGTRAVAYRQTDVGCASLGTDSPGIGSPDSALVQLGAHRHCHGGRFMHILDTSVTT